MQIKNDRSMNWNNLLSRREAADLLGLAPQTLVERLMTGRNSSVIPNNSHSMLMDSLHQDYSEPAVCAENQNSNNPSTPNPNFPMTNLNNPSVNTVEISAETVSVEPTAGHPQYEFHALCLLFPQAGEDTLEAMTRDIAANGLLDPIVLFEDKILDGRNRLLACRKAGVEPRFEEYSGNDPLQFVLTRNLRRRQLSKSQQAMVAARSETFGHGGARRFQDANLHLERKKVSELTGVSPRSIADAATVLKSGNLELIEAVDGGKISVSAAALKVKQQQTATGDTCEPMKEVVEPGEITAETMKSCRSESKNDTIERLKAGAALETSPSSNPSHDYADQGDFRLNAQELRNEIARHSGITRLFDKTSNIADDEEQQAEFQELCDAMYGSSMSLAEHLQKKFGAKYPLVA